MLLVGRFQGIGPVFLATIAVASTSGCNEGIANTASFSGELAGAPLRAYRLAFLRRSPDQVASRGQAMLQALLRRDVDRAEVLALATAKAAVRERWYSPLTTDPGVVVSHDSEHDDLWVLNEGAQVSAASPDIGLGQARRIFEDVVASLGAAGALVTAHFDLSKVDVAFTQRGSGQGDQVTPAVTTEYRFTAMRQLDGVDMANAGLRVVVDRTGMLTMIRLGGAEVLASDGTVSTSAPAATLSRTVLRSDVLSRFGREVPDGVVESDRLLYALPDGVKDAVVEPRHTVLFARRTGGSAQTVVTRSDRVAYSIATATAPRLLLSPPPTSDLKGDPRP